MSGKVPAGSPIPGSNFVLFYCPGCGDAMRIPKRTWKKYLKKGAVIGLCSECTKEQRSLSGKRKRPHKSRYDEY